MKRLVKFRKDEDTQIDITPMLDVVFIMLIFFIVTSSFVKESGATIEKPEAENAQVRPKATIMIGVDADDLVWVDREEIDPRAIKSTILRMKAENPESEVIIQADQESTTEVLLKVVDGLREAGIVVPSIATTKS